MDFSKKIYGEMRSKVTGAHDTVVDGDSSSNIKGECNITCQKGMNTSVAGALNTVAKSQNTKVSGQLHSQADNMAFNTAGDSVNDWRRCNGLFNAGWI
jgi:hypothetical protein